MKTRSLLKAGLAVLLSVTLIGCTGSSRQAQLAAGDRIGIAAAGVALADQPAECGIDTPHASLVLGEEAVVTLRRERQQLDKSNFSKARCYTFNENQR